jgi:hypothetical protein
MSTTIFVSSPDTYGERRIDLHWTLEYFKARLEQITGIPSSLQSLTVFHSVDDYERFKSNGSGDGVGIGSENDLKTLMELGIVEMCLVRVSCFSPIHPLGRVERSRADDSFLYPILPTFRSPTPPTQPPPLPTTTAEANSPTSPLFRNTNSHSTNTRNVLIPYWLL